MNRTQRGWLAAALSGWLLVACATATEIRPPVQATTHASTTPVPELDVATTLTTAGSTRLDRKRLLELAKVSVVRVRNTGCGELSLGTAWLANDGQMVSNRHVVEGLQFVEMSTWDGHDLVARSATVADGADISRIVGQWAGAPDLRPMTTRATRVESGERVSILGYPEGGELAVSTGEAMEYIVDTDLAPREILKITATVRPGNSGGPVVDESGQVIGVVYASEIATDDTLVIPISDVFGPTAAPLTTEPACG